MLQSVTLQRHSAFWNAKKTKKLQRYIKSSNKVTEKYNPLPRATQSQQTTLRKQTYFNSQFQSVLEKKLNPPVMCSQMMASINFDIRGFLEVR